jgi:hypothetical protein
MLGKIFAIDKQIRAVLSDRMIQCWHDVTIRRLHWIPMAQIPCQREASMDSRRRCGSSVFCWCVLSPVKRAWIPTILLSHVLLLICMYKSTVGGVCLWSCKLSSSGATASAALRCAALSSRHAKYIYSLIKYLLLRLHDRLPCNNVYGGHVDGWWPRPVLCA